MAQLEKTDARGAATPFVIAAIAALALALIASLWLAQAPASYSAYDRLGAEVGCQCGTCPMRPIATCGCGFADGMLEEVRSSLAAGASEQEVRAQLVSRYGQQVLIVPETSGFDLTAWALPIVALLVGAVGVAGFVAHLARKDDTVPAAAKDPARSDAAVDEGADRPDAAGQEGPAPTADENGSSETDRERARRTVEAELDDLD